MQGVGNNVTSNASLRTRVLVWIREIPLVTRATFLVCVGVFLLELLTTGYMPFHIGLVHITMNMMSYLPMATTLERKVGSFQFFYATMLFTVINGMLHVTISELFHLNSCSAGLSGVIFSILVVDISASMEPTQNVLGLFNVPTATYPWVLLIMMSLMIPNVSFVGHLCGIVSGYLYVLGLLNWIIPSNEKVAMIEGSWWYTKIVNIKCYITGTSTGVTPVYNGSTFRQRCTLFWDQIKNILNRNQTTELPVTMRTSQGGQALGSSFDGKSQQTTSTA